MIEGKAILSLSPFPAAPLFHGAIVRIHHLNRILAHTNRLFFVFRGDPQGNPPGFDCQPVPNSRLRPLQIFNPFLVIKLRRLVRSEQVDLILSSHIWCGLHGLLLKLLTGKRFLFDDHNVEYLRFKRTSSLFWPLVWLLEWTICRGADRVSCVSDTDRDFLISHLGVRPDKIDVVPNGVDVEGCSRTSVDIAGVRAALGLGPEDLLALFFGTLDYQPNVTAAEIIVKELTPRLEQQGCEFRIVIAGRGDSSERLTELRKQSRRVAFVGFVQDIVAYIKSADVIIVPLTMGSGTRFKILESIGCGRRVVSTSIGAEGLDRDALGDSLALRDDWDAFAVAMVETAKKPPLPPSDAFVQIYDWRYIVNRLRI